MSVAALRRLRLSVMNAKACSVFAVTSSSTARRIWRTMSEFRSAPGTSPTVTTVKEAIKTMANATGPWSDARRANSTCAKTARNAPTAVAARRNTC